MTEDEKEAIGRHRRPEGGEGGEGAKKKAPMPIDKLAAGLTRQIRSYERRCVEDPEGLAHLRPIKEALSDVERVTAATHRTRSKLKMSGAVPGTVVAELMGVVPSRATKIADEGDAIMRAREELVGVVRFPEATIDKRRRTAALEESKTAVEAARAIREAAGERTGTDG